MRNYGRAIVKQPRMLPRHADIDQGLSYDQATAVRGDPGIQVYVLEIIGSGLVPASSDEGRSADHDRWVTERKVGHQKAICSGSRHEFSRSIDQPKRRTYQGSIRIRAQDGILLRQPIWMSDIICIHSGTISASVIAIAALELPTGPNRCFPRSSRILHCYPTSDHLGLEFSALLRSGGLVSPAEFASMIGGIFPIALCGRSSL